MNKKIISSFTFIFILLVTTTSLFSQEKASIPDIEKTYLHTDRSTYVLDESVWYKAYLVDAYNNLLFDHSKILYVELISPAATIVARNKIKLIGGLGHGDFKLTGTMGVKTPGKYQIRAYTNWTRNFGNDFVFKKEIEVIDVFESQKRANKSNELSNTEVKEGDENSNQIIEKSIAIQFFPEGGSLIQNVSSLIAFKAVDENGNPIRVQGQILDENDELISMFMSAHDGMGKFQLSPVKGKQYHAVVTTENSTQIDVSLPRIEEQGFLLSYKQIREQQVLTIKTNPETLLKEPNSPLTIRYTTRGIPYSEETITLTKNTVSFELNNTNLPEGISQITLYDSQMRPQSERLVYIEKNKNIQVEISTDKSIYSPKEKVIVNVSSKNQDGEGVLASYSLASSDLNGVKDQNAYDSNICSFFLLESDIRGKVHNPGYYFDSKNPRRFQYLDLLLLTQGWRDFLWKKERSIDDNSIFEVEKGINITGKVKKLFADKPEVGNAISLALLNKGIENFNTVTDTIGMFKFEDIDITGKARIILNSKNKKGKKNGEFVLDPIFKLPMSVDPINDTNALGYSAETEHMAQNIYKKHVAFEVVPENILDAVEIVAVKSKSSGNLNLNSNLMKGYVIDEASPQFADIFQLLEYAVPLLDVGNREVIKFFRNSGGALIVINQTRILDPADGGVFEYLSMIQPDDVLKIESDNSTLSTMMYGNQARNGVIMISTKSYKDYPKNDYDPSSIKEQIEGYYEARLFYVPNLEVSNSNSDKTNAIRNTLYWNPYVHPDKNGVSRVEYYNTEVETHVKVTLEGMTATGIPIVLKTQYRIEN